MEEGDDMQLTTTQLPPKALFLSASITMEIASDFSQWAQAILEGLFFSLRDIEIYSISGAEQDMLATRE